MLAGAAAPPIEPKLADVPYLAREFQAKFDELDLLQLPNYRIYLKLMIDGTPSAPFSASTPAPPTQA